MTLDTNLFITDKNLIIGFEFSVEILLVDVVDLAIAQGKFTSYGMSIALADVAECAPMWCY